MFDFFKKKEPGVKVNDKIWMTTTAKYEACVQMAMTTPDVILICWFEKTKEDLERCMAAEKLTNKLLQAEEVKSIEGKSIPVFVEHYPLARVEQPIFKSLSLSEAAVLSALDEPLFKLAGGTRLQSAVSRLGLDDGEVISHDFMSKAIWNVQSKIESKVVTEKKTRSMEDWFSANLPTFRP